MFILHEVMELTEQSRGYYERLTNPVGVYAPNTVFAKVNARPNVQCNQYSTGALADGTLTLPVEQLTTFDEEAKSAIKQLGALALTPGQQVVVLCQKPAERDRLRELILEHTPHAIDDITLEVGYLHRGFIWNPSAIRHPPSAIHVIPHHELFHRYHVRRRVRRITGGAQVGDAFLDLDVGDYVVHVDHGIARFTGIKTLRRGGLSQEYLTLAFAQDAVLHVPATQIDLVQKYVGGFEGRPPLSTLGGKRWGKQKQQVAEAVKDLAAELFARAGGATDPAGHALPRGHRLATRVRGRVPLRRDRGPARRHRRDQAGHGQGSADGPPGLWRRWLRQDGGGDPRGVQSGRVRQAGRRTRAHHGPGRTARPNLRPAHGRLPLQSRFHLPIQDRRRNRPSSSKTWHKARWTSSSARIGCSPRTCSSPTWAWVIIDEEQRFGVEHKNQLLRFRLTAEVLTLTATPIPRTLHMSMIGLRDISSLSTPPADRRAIVTEVVPLRPQARQAGDHP